MCFYQFQIQTFMLRLKKTTVQAPAVSRSSVFHSLFVPIDHVKPVAPLSLCASQRKVMGQGMNGRVSHVTPSHVKHPFFSFFSTEPFDTLWLDGRFSFNQTTEQEASVEQHLFQLNTNFPFHNNTLGLANKCIED